jgi:prolipoprotein diacylglyceryltransferase
MFAQDAFDETVLLAVDVSRGMLESFPKITVAVCSSTLFARRNPEEKINWLLVFFFLSVGIVRASLEAADGNLQDWNIGTVGRAIML